jgi:transcriptional regulator with XRE-family HTH domain
MLFFKDNLKILMKRYNLSGERLGDKTGLTKGAISSYITGGAYPKVEKLLKIAETLEVDLEDLFYTDLSKSDNYVKSQIETDNTEGVVQVANGNGGDVRQRTGASVEVYERFLKSQDERIGELKEMINLLRLKNKE